MSVAHGWRRGVHARCKTLGDEHGCGGERVVELDEACADGGIRAAALKLFAVSCGACDAACDGSALFLASSMWTSHDSMAAIAIVNATFALMRLTPVVTKKRRGDDR